MSIKLLIVYFWNKYFVKYYVHSKKKVSFQSKMKSSLIKVSSINNVINWGEEEIQKSIKIIYREKESKKYKKIGNIVYGPPLSCKIFMTVYSEFTEWNLRDFTEQNLKLIKIFFLLCYRRYSNFAQILYRNIILKNLECKIFCIILKEWEGA